MTLKAGVYIGPENSAYQGGGMYLANGSDTDFNGLPNTVVAGNVASAGGPGVYQQNGANVDPAVPNLTDRDDPGGKPFPGP